MSKQIQNFYKSTLSLEWTVGTGNFYVTTKPTITDGWLVVSPNNTALREIVKYTNTGTDANGDYITISERGVGGTSEQTHSLGEPIRMNITAEYWKNMNDAIDAIVAGAAPDADTDTKGLVEIATQSEVDSATNIGSTGATLVVTPSTLGITGIILPYAGATAPNGWLICNGDAISRTTYSNLFSLISTTYGVGDNSTTFNIPDLRGRVAVGKSTDTEFDTLGETGGEKTHVLTVHEMPSHTHDFSAGVNTGSNITLFKTNNVSGSGTSTAAGEDGAHNNLQPYITLNYIIKY